MKIKDSYGNTHPISLPATAPGGAGEYYIVCPFCVSRRKPNHQKEKKLGVNMVKKDYPWRCNVCGEGGYVYTDEDMTHRKIKPILTFPKCRPAEDRHYKWLAKRNINKKTADKFRMNISNENVLQIKHKDPAKKGTWENVVCLNFPYYQDDQLINIKYRDPRKNFKLIAGAMKVFYNIDSIKGKEYCIITEGEFDAMAYHQAGLTSVVSVPNGATVSKQEKEHFEETGLLKVFNPLNLEYLDLNIERFDHIKTIYLATDDDATGVKLRMELARRLGKERCKFIKFSDYRTADEDHVINDPNHLLIERGEAILADTINKAYDFPIENVSTAKDHLEEALSDFNHGREKGKPSGFESLDPYFSLVDGWLYMLNGYPNEGKTTVMLNIMAVSTILYGYKWGLYSPENYPVKNIIDTLAEIFLNNTSNPAISGRIKPYDYKDVILEHIDKHFFFVDNEDGYTPKELLIVKEDLVKKKGINGFFTDPWSALNHTEIGQREDHYIAQCLNREIRLAKKYNIINVISHHPPKPADVKGTLKAPHPYQLSGGSMWWNKSDVIFCVHRVNRTDYTDNKLGVHVQKVKDVKIFGDKTNIEEPVVLQYSIRTSRLLERENIADRNSIYNKFPFKKWESKKQLSLDNF